MRIGLITADFYPNVGGVAAHVVELGRALAKLGHSVDVITRPLGEQRQRTSELHGMSVHRPPVPKGKPLFTWLMRTWLKVFLQRESLDVLHIHGLRPLEATVGLDLPVIFTNHTSGFLKRIEKGPAARRKMTRRLAHIAHVLAPSDELVAATRAVDYPGPVDFIPNGVDATRFTPGPTGQRAVWKVAEDEVVVLLARRLVEKNGVVVFADAVTRLQNASRIVFAGDGAERPKVEQILRDGGCLDRCVFLGNVPNPDMPDIYRAANISVLPSFMEATSITGLESMACGLPLVGTRVGGIPTLIRHEETGLLVDSHDPAGLAQGLDRLIADRNLRVTMGQAARQRAVAHFAWEQIAAQTVEVYQRYVGDAGNQSCDQLRQAG
jgi:glycosyltransferase involved in cell wall biosynthesis